RFFVFLRVKITNKRKVGDSLEVEIAFYRVDRRINLEKSILICEIFYTFVKIIYRINNQTNRL
ncbi:hypothetical protein ACI75Y_04365, partial [Capnocytophaga stomatis]